jgi:hypothetical protein
MKDFLARLAARALNTAPVVEPLLASRYAPADDGAPGSAAAWREPEPAAARSAVEPRGRRPRSARGLMEVAREVESAPPADAPGAVVPRLAPDAASWRERGSGERLVPRPAHAPEPRPAPDDVFDADAATRSAPRGAGERASAGQRSSARSRRRGRGKAARGLEEIGHKMDAASDPRAEREDGLLVPRADRSAVDEARWTEAADERHAAHAPASAESTGSRGPASAASTGSTASARTSESTGSTASASSSESTRSASTASPASARSTAASASRRSSADAGRSAAPADESLARPLSLADGGVSPSLLEVYAEVDARGIPAGAAAGRMRGGEEGGLLVPAHRAKARDAGGEEDGEEEGGRPGTPPAARRDGAGRREQNGDGDAPPTVRVSVGRVEIRALEPAAKRRRDGGRGGRRAEWSPPVLSLDGYLRGGGEP